MVKAKKRQKKNTVQAARNFPNLIIYSLSGVLLAVLCLRYATPLRDGDIFFHLSYAKDILLNGTLIPDHTLYSWTDARADNIYCAWLGQLILYLIYQIGGFSLLFVLRYGCLFFVLWLVWRLLKKQDDISGMLSLLLLLFVALGSHAAVMIKPEIFSLILMALMAFLYFQAKLSLYGKHSLKFLFFMPLIFLVWINTHGVWIMGICLYSIIVAGELLNMVLGRRSNLDPAFSKNLVLSYLATLPALIITPYGVSYPLSLLGRIMRVISPSQSQTQLDAGISLNFAYKNILTTISNPSMNLVSLWCVMLVLFLIVFVYHYWKTKTIDWAVLLLNTALAYLFLKYVRATYYWGPFWAFSIVYLINKIKGPVSKFKKERHRLIHLILILLFCFFSSLTIYKSIFIPGPDSFTGFGFSSWATVDEAEFLKKNNLGKNLFNSYKTGAFLAWELYPDYKVLIDARRFPFTAIINDYVEFQDGKKGLNAFRKKYPFETAVVDHSYFNIFTKFFNSAEWQAIYYGSAATIFIPTGSPIKYDFLNEDRKRFDKVKNIMHAYKAFRVAMNLDDMAAAEYLTANAEKKIIKTKDEKEKLQRMQDIFEGLKAYENGRFESAYQLLDRHDNRIILKVTQALIHIRGLKIRQMAAEGNYDGALALVEANLKSMPNNGDLLYSAGALAHMVRHQTPLTRLKKKKYLTRFLSRYPGHSNALYARRALSSQTVVHIPLGL